MTYAWLVENFTKEGQSTGLYMACQVNMTLTADVNAARRFRRQHTAEFRAADMRDARGGDWRAVEHGFDDGKTPNFSDEDVGPVDGSVRPVAWVSIDGLKDLHGCNAMSVWCGNPAIYDDQTAGPEKLAPVYGRGTVDRLTSERHDLALLVGRLIRRMRAARTGEGIAAGDDALEQQAIGYLRRKGLVSPLRDETAAASKPPCPHTGQCYPGHCPCLEARA